MTHGFFGVFFFKQKTAYEVRISDWSSDVCSSDLRAAGPRFPARRGARPSGSRSPADRRRPGRCAVPKAPTARRGGLRSWSDRQSVVWGKSVSVRVDLAGGRITKKKNKKHTYEPSCSDP